MTFPQAVIVEIEYFPNIESCDYMQYHLVYIMHP